MESLHDQQQPDADPGIPGELDYAATATSNRDATASAVLLPRSTLPTARREEVQRLFCSILVIRCESNTQYAAPVIVMSQEDSNIYAVLERHLKREYLLGAEKFWRLVRAELGVDTWRPRVQGAQLKALLGARLPEYEQEFQEIQRVVDSLQDCILPESSPEALMQDLRTTISQIQAWWENRNKKSDGESLAVLPQHGISSSLDGAKQLMWARGVLCRSRSGAGGASKQSACKLGELPPSSRI